MRSADGKPIAGAQVRAVDSLSIYSWYAAGYGSHARTDDRGVFVLPGVFSRAMEIGVTADGHYERNHAWVDLGSPLDVQLQPSGFVEGRVLDADGKPCDGMVRISYEFVSTVDRTAELVRGRFRLSLAQPCRYRVAAYSTQGTYLGQSELSSGPAADLEIRAAREDRAGFRVQAVDAKSGAKVAAIRAAVLWMSGEAASYELEILRLLLQPGDPDGIVALDTDAPAADKGCFYVQAEGYAPFCRADVPRADGKLVAELVPEARLEGKVIDADTKQPLANVALTCEARTKRRRRGSDSTRRQVVAITAADGTFTIRGLAAGTYEVQARAPIGTTTAKQDVVVEAGQRRAGVELAVPSGAAVRGRVPGGGSPEGWRLALTERSDPDTRERSESRTGVLGATNVAGSVPIVDDSFRFERRAGGPATLQLVVPLPPRHGDALQIELTKLEIGATELEVDVDVAAHLPSTIRGQLTFAGDEMPRGRLAVVAARVSPRENGYLDYDEQLLRRRWTLVEENGSYAVPVAPGQHQLEVVDVANGLVLLTADGPVSVAAGKAASKDLCLAVVRAEVALDWEDPARPSSQRVEVVLGERRQHDYQLTLFAGGTLGTAGFDLVGADSSLPLFVPPGRVQLRARASATRIDRGSSYYGSDRAVAEVTFTAELGRRSAVTLRLPLPAPMQER